jgi:hypothetical protein
MKRAMHFGLLGWLALTLASPLVAQPFTYQGFLKDQGSPANGIYDFRFRLWTAPSGGVQVGPELYVDDVSVQNGLFTVQLDFGAVWDGSDRYLEILVRLNDAFGYWLLTPRVKINPTPYASFALRPWQTSGSNIFYNDGNVGIGTSSPAARLSLGGGDANTKLAIWQGNTASQVMGMGVGPAQFRLHLNNSSDRFSFLNAPAGAELVTIRGNGFVGIGTANPVQNLHVEGQCYFRGFVGIAAPFPNYPLEVRAGTGTAVAGFANMSGAGSGYGVYGFSMTTSGSGAYFVSNGLTGAIVARTGGSYQADWPTGWGGGLATWDICASGILATEFRNRSDERLKRDILPLDAPTELQRLLSLRPVSYYWKDERLSQERQFGFIAQELREVFPELVQESIDEQKTLSVNYQALIPLLVNALQVQQQTIEQQQVELRQLREELQQLRALLTQKR